MFQIDYQLEGLARARGEIRLTREFAVELNLDLLLKKAHLMPYPEPTCRK